MRKVLLVISLLLLATADANAQCAMCRAVLESEETQSAARGINNGIVYLMAIPYLLMAGLGYVIYRSRRKAKEAKN